MNFGDLRKETAEFVFAESEGTTTGKSVNIKARESLLAERCREPFEVGFNHLKLKQRPQASKFLNSCLCRIGAGHGAIL